MIEPRRTNPMIPTRNFCVMTLTPLSGSTDYGLPEHKYDGHQEKRGTHDHPQIPSRRDSFQYGVKERPQKQADDEEDASPDSDRERCQLKPAVGRKEVPLRTDVPGSVARCCRRPDDGRKEHDKIDQSYQEEQPDDRFPQHVVGKERR